MDQRFDKKNKSKYIGHTCLYKRYGTDNDYNCIYVIDIQDDLIKYRTKNGNIYYTDLSYFANTYFRISPFEDKENNNEPIQTQPVIQPDANYLCTEHVWEFIGILTYPPTLQRKCKKCGRIQYQDLAGDWHDTNKQFYA